MRREGEHSGAAELRRIRLMSVGPPVLFVVALQLVCFALLREDALPPVVYGLMVVVPVAVVVAFAHGMLRVIGRAQLHVVDQNAQLVEANGLLERRKNEGHVFYEVLLQISNQAPSSKVLTAIVDGARGLLGSDGGGLCLDDEALFLVRLDEPVAGGELFADGAVCSVSDECASSCEQPAGSCAVRRPPEWAAKLAVPVRGPWGALGELWIGRRTGPQYSERDRRFLVSLAGLVEIALAGARARELEHEGAVLAERQRLAREMHDGLAQVLGATHLRLRGLGPRAEGLHDARLVEELEDIADSCQEAYQDVREAISGLREAAPHGLLASLRNYVDKFARQSGLQASLVCDVAHDLDLSPRCEVQVVRVVQEALTNVRKHADATRALVRVSETGRSTVFTVEDDGCGFELLPGAERDGYGLQSMRDRIQLLNGRLSVESAPGRGTRVVAEVPVLSAARPLLTR